MTRTNGGLHMERAKTALESTSAHGLPRIVANKPVYIRIAWLLVFLCMASLFLKGFVEFVIKLRSNPVTTSADSNVAVFEFPDIYACFENPISGSYSATMDAKSIKAINDQLNVTARALFHYALARGATLENAFLFEHTYSYLHPQSMPYHILIDTLAHRIEQGVISSNLLYKKNTGMPGNIALTPGSFIHPLFLRCIQWRLNDTLQRNVVQSSSSAALVTVMLIDADFSGYGYSGPSLETKVYAGNSPIPVSDWSLVLEDFYAPDRSAGIRIFLAPPGEYPTEFGTSFSLGPGKQHTVEIGMTNEVYQEGHFQCDPKPASIQFVNPYDQTPYRHTYSYSYCYFYEYHKLFQSRTNLSGDIAPVPWPLRGKDYIHNLTNEGVLQTLFSDDKSTTEGPQDQFARIAKEKCEPKRPCSTLDYSVSISSADWPTQSSLVPFVNSSIQQAWGSAKAKNLSVPALDFLLTSSNASSVASYVRSNLLKVHFKPRRVMCDRYTFSKDYGASSFISDVGGIMGIYLGMSLLTLCEIFELVHDLIIVTRRKRKMSAAVTDDRVGSSKQQSSSVDDSPQSIATSS